MATPFRVTRRWACLVVAGLCLLLMGKGAANAKPILHHDISVRLEPASHRLHAVDRVTIAQLKKDHLVFSLAGHLKIKRITLNDAQIDFRFRGSRLYIPIRPSRSDGRLVIEYDGVFNDKVDVQPLNTDNPGYGVTGTIQPQGTLLLAGARWYPQGNEAGATYTLTVDAPQGTLAVTTGNSMGHATSKGRTVSRWGVDKPLEGLSLAAGPFQLATQVFGAVTAATYFSEPLKRLSPDYLQAVGRYLKLYEERFGPYPYKQFAVVENFFPTGYGFASFTLMGRRVLQLPFIIHTSLGHEVAHCWWGNGVMVDTSQGNWSEGLTSYVADYFYKEQQGEGADYRRQWLRNYAVLVNDGNDFALSKFTHRSDPATKTVGYDKAAMVFHMLRRVVGEEKFWQTLRDVYLRYRFQAISWRHWQSAFEQAAGHSLERFFNQWVYRPGAPNLVLSDVAVTPAKSGFTIKGHIEQSRPYFDVTIDATVQTETDSQQRSLTVSGARTPFTWQVDTAPKALALDPEAHLFRRLAPSELPPTVNAIKGATGVTVVVAQDLDNSGWLNMARRLTAALGLEGATIGREGHFSESQLANSNLIWIGRPRDSRWLPEKPTAFSLNAKQLKLSGQSFSQEAISFFGVFHHPRHKNRVAALFLPQSLEQASVLCTKIPHYGKYSYLIFQASRNRVKGTWAVDASPLTMQWSENDISRSKRGAL